MPQQLKMRSHGFKLILLRNWNPWNGVELGAGISINGAVPMRALENLGLYQQVCWNKVVWRWRSAIHLASWSFKLWSLTITPSPVWFLCGRQWAVFFFVRLFARINVYCDTWVWCQCPLGLHLYRHSTDEIWALWLFYRMGSKRNELWSCCWCRRPALKIRKEFVPLKWLILIHRSGRVACDYARGGGGGGGGGGRTAEMQSSWRMWMGRSP